MNFDILIQKDLDILIQKSEVKRENRDSCKTKNVIKR